MATILSVFKGVCPVIGLDIPDVVYSSTERQYVELGALANEMAERIARAHEWQKLNALATHTGDGATQAFDLPSDYDRMPAKAQVWSSSLETPLTHIADRDEWLGIDVQTFDFVINAWTLLGDQVLIKPALASGVTAKHYYQSNLVVAPNSGANKAEFTADDDVFRLDAQLLKLGMIWQWRANKGLSYGEDMANYESLLEKRITADAGSRKLAIGRGRLPRGLRTAYPQNITP